MPYHISLPRPMAARLDEAARAERRKPSNMVEKIIMDFFDAEEASAQAKPNGIHKNAGRGSARAAFPAARHVRCPSGPGRRHE